MTSNRPIAYNVLRLVMSALDTTPRGIDRIDFGYLSHLFEQWPGECFGVLPTVLGTRLFDRERILRGRDRIAGIWREHQDVGSDEAFARLKNQFSIPVPPELGGAARQKLLNRAGLARMLRLLFDEAVDLGRPMSALPARSIYLDVGHAGFAWPTMFNWLDRRPDVAPVFMVHDTIPLEHPRFETPATIARHRRAMALTARLAHAVIVPTAAVAHGLEGEFASLGARTIPVHAVPLPIERMFARGMEPDPDLAARPYFLVCGAIEPRKNIGLLLDVWEAMVAKRGADAPHLVIAGGRSNGSEAFLARIRASADLNGSVHHAEGLSSPAITRLMAGARALLMPSFAEGFGLPPAEAMAIGTPAVLSDIPAHRDSAGEFGVFIDPLNVPAWQAEIEALTSDPAHFESRKRRVELFSPLDWSGYMARIRDILLDLPQAGPSA